MYGIKHLSLSWWPFHNEVMKRNLHIRNINVLRVEDMPISHLSKGSIYAHTSFYLVSTTILFY